MKQDLVIAGATGNVGKTLISQIFERGDTRRDFHRNPTRVIGLASTASYVFDSRGLSKERCDEFTKAHISGKTPTGSLREALREVEESELERDGKVVFVDVTASNDMLGFHQHIVDKTPYGLITANKLPLVEADDDEFNRLTSETERYGYSCSVMAGAGVIDFLRDRRDLRDPIASVSGCFSGTLGYLVSRMSEGTPFSEALMDAKERGYTEPDPREDLNGKDVARKLLILARTTGLDTSMRNIDVNPFIPTSYFRDEPIATFMKRAGQLDRYFAEKVATANEQGEVLRYVAEMDLERGTPSLKVSLKKVSRASPLGTLQGTLNKVTITSELYPKDSPYSITAPGAGLPVTAGNIRADLLALLDGRRVTGTIN